MHFLKKIGVWLTLAALTSTQAIFAHHLHDSHRSHHSHHSHDSNHQSIRLARISLFQILNDLNVTLLAEVVPSPITSSLVTAYNLDIANASANI